MTITSHDRAATLGSCERGAQVALIEIERGQFVGARGFETEQSEVSIARSASCCCKSCTRSRMSRVRSTGIPVRRRNSCARSKIRRIGGAGRGLQRILGARALDLGDAPLLRRHAPLPSGHPCQHQRHHQTRRGRRQDATLPRTLGIAAARVGGERFRDEGAHARRQLGAEPLVELRGAGDQRRRCRKEVGLAVGGRLRPFRRHRRERIADADQRRILLDDGDRRRHDPQQRLVHGAEPHDAAGLLGRQEPAVK